MTTLTPGGQRLADTPLNDSPEIKAFRTAALDAIQNLRHLAASNFTPAYSGSLGEARCNSFYEAYQAVRTLPAPQAATTLTLDAPPAGGDGGLREAARTLLDACHADFGEPEAEDVEGRDDGCVGGGATPADGMAITFAMLRDLEKALARPDPREQAAAGPGVEPFTVDWFRSLFAEPLWNVPHWQRDVLLAVSALTQPNQTPEAAAPSGAVGEKPAKERARELRDIILSDVRAASRPFAMPGEPVGVSAGRLSNILTARLGCHFAALATPQPAPQAPVADAAGVDWEREAARLRAELTRIHDFSASSMLIRNDALDMIRSVARQALKSAALTPPQAARPGDGAVVPLDVREALKAVADARKAYQQEGAPWSTLAAARARFDIISHAWFEKQIAPVQADAAEGRS